MPFLLLHPHDRRFDRSRESEPAALRERVAQLLVEDALEDLRARRLAKKMHAAGLAHLGHQGRDHHGLELPRGLARVDAPAGAATDPELALDRALALGVDGAKGIHGAPQYAWISAWSAPAERSFVRMSISSRGVAPSVFITSASSESVAAPCTSVSGRLSSCALMSVRGTTVVVPVSEIGAGCETIGDSAIAIVRLPRAMRQGPSVGWPVTTTVDVFWSTSTTARSKGCTPRSEEHTSELQSLRHLVCRLLLEKK